MKFSYSLIPFALLWVANFCSAQTVGFDFSNLNHELIQFNGTGDQISFGANTNDHGFNITSTTQPGLDGRMGSIDGTFTIGAITNLGGGFEQAPVTGTGTFKVFEPGSSTVALTANVNWGDLLRVGPAGILNPNAMLNLSDFQYFGADAALKALAASLSGTTVVTFQFLPPVTLEQLTADGTTHSASYSGTATTDALVVAIPEPSLAAALLGGVVLFGVALRRRWALAA